MSKDGLPQRQRRAGLLEENEHWKYKRWYGKIEEENE